ncbi:hypothetical protein GCM10022280_03420 [Sphingomonas swuensis]|uniref:Uncharacterized protein n=2 Tax=Sphingomonas swuensis TaxID=977800 RepID=A0ABP7SC10_9SPHN
MGTAELSVLITDRDPPERPYVRLQAPGSGNFVLDLTFRTADRKIGAIGVASLRAKVLPGSDRFVQLEWREAGAAEWFNEGYKFQPRFYPGDPLGHVDTRMGQGPPLPFRADLLEALQRGTTFEVRSLTDTGAVIEAGKVALPAPALVEQAYASAYASAMKSLGPCGAPMIIVPARPPAKS